MYREFDDFIIIPDLADAPLKTKREYYDANFKATPEMVVIQIQGKVASWVHDSTDLEEKTIEFYEQKGSGIRAKLQEQLDKMDESLRLNENVVVYALDVLAPETEHCHKVRFTLIHGERRFDLFCYGLEFVDS